MKREVVLSKKTSQKLARLLNYLEDNWSKKTKENFLEKLDKVLSNLSEYPQSSEKSSLIKGLHKCVVTKQTTIFYKFTDDNLYVVAVFDTRQNPKKIKKELKS